MTSCECCGNDSENTFTVIMNGSTHVYDSFECAIDALAPICAYCGARIIGAHWLSSGDAAYCNARCMQEACARAAKGSV